MPLTHSRPLGYCSILTSNSYFPTQYVSFLLETHMHTNESYIPHRHTQTALSFVMCYQVCETKQQTAWNISKSVISKVFNTSQF